VKKESGSRSAFISSRVLFSVLCTAVACSILTFPVLGVLRSEGTANQRTLSFEERVSYQRAIEEVYWRHRIWPKERPDPKPPVDAVISEAQLEKKVADYLRKSQALEDYWQRPITAEQLQAEMDRMVKQTKQPDVLGELFEALGNDPFVIAECLARPALTERFLTNWDARDERIHRRTLESWLTTAESRVPNSRSVPNAIYVLPVISDGSGCIEDTWSAIVVNVPSGRWGHTAVWTGSEMIVWGGRQDAVNTGWRYNPATDSWTPTSAVNAPAGRYDHTAVWTGSEMIVWGGFGGSNTGGKYNPNTDSWAATSITNAPAARGEHTAVWTGNEMIIWGGSTQVGESNKDWKDNFNLTSPPTPTPTPFPYLNTGGRYNPNTDSWTITSMANVPEARAFHTAVWTGGEMIVWGGITTDYSSTGGRYNPNTDTWTTTSTANAPSGRDLHTGVWTGDEMIVWGGNDRFGNAFNTGGKYNPAMNNWIATSIVNAPTGRYSHTAVWTGSEMVVWGGSDYPNFFNTGGRYNPATDSWTPTSATSAPASRDLHTAVWTGSEMIVWGGYNGIGDYTNTGGRYNPKTDNWVATPDAVQERFGHTAIWTGNEMIVWGGGFGGFNTGGIYNPSTDTWTDTSTINAPTGRYNHTAVWTGSEMIVWGGGWYFAGFFNTGGRYNPSTDSWTATSTLNAPSARDQHTAVWTGSEMIIWAGEDWLSNYLNSGGRYDPASDSWTATSTTNAPEGRRRQTAVWTGSEMLVWGGDFVDNNGYHYLNTGGRYDPGPDSWTATSTTNAPEGRESHTVVWADGEMIVWGGYFDIPGNRIFLNTGGIYDPGTDSWRATGIINAPTERAEHTAVWTDSEMIIWGGYFQDNAFHFLNTGGRYSPSADSWTPTSITNVPSERAGHTAVWTGSEMIVWGGSNISNGPLSTGGRYCAQSGPTPTPTPSITPTPTPTPTPRTTPRPRPTPHPRPTPR
jgi:N-acetylneuraminic acid mutarotase